jgi:hypothetical protein
MLAQFAADNQPIAPSPQEEMNARLDGARFQEQFAEYVIAAGVRPKAIKHVGADAREHFEMQNGRIVVRNDATDPNDPLAPLSPQKWVESLMVSQPFLFL